MVELFQDLRGYVVIVDFCKEEKKNLMTLVSMKTIAHKSVGVWGFSLFVRAILMSLAAPKGRIDTFYLFYIPLQLQYSLGLYSSFTLLIVSAPFVTLCLSIDDEIQGA